MKFLIIFALISLSFAQHLRDAAKSIYIGTAIAQGHLSDTQYKTIAAQEFNVLTPENEMKWDTVEGTKGSVNYAPADAIVAFAVNNSMKVRGHTLIWHSQLPNWVANLDKATLETTYKKHITDEMTHFKGKIYAWDVVNEVFNEDGTLRQSPYSKAFNNTFISEAFKTARAADPAAKLYINDYNTENKGAKSDGLYNLVKTMKTAGVPIDGVGFQSHFIMGSIPSDFASNMQRFADLDLDVAITELDIRMTLPDSTANAQKQATDYANVIKACEAVSRCVGVTIWGFTDKYSWVPDQFKGQGDALIYDSSYKAKAAVQAIQAVLK